MVVIIMRSKNIDDDKDNILYSEWVPLNKILVILIFLLAALLISIAIIISILEPQYIAISLSLSGVLSLLFLFIGWNFRSLQITLTKNEIKVKYGMFNHKIISLHELVSCEVTNTSFRKYGGMGIRIGFDCSWAYVTDFGDAVKLTFQESKLFVFSTKNNQEICFILNKFIEKNEKNQNMGV